MRLLLSPLLLFYLPVVIIRNKLFDAGIFRSVSFPVPLISVGNLTMGGTGKTPHTEYLTRLLLEEERPVAILSRGYGRKTNGFIIVRDEHSHIDVGDEPCQYYHRLHKENVVIAVDSNRRRGIRNLMQTFPSLKAIILDDAFQHRYVQPGLNIVLSDYYNPFFKDKIFPLGDLREPRYGIKRAQIIIITKSPAVVSPLVRKDILSKLPSKRKQHLFFSKIIYGEITSIDHQNVLKLKNELATIFLITGIANPYPLEEHLRTKCLRLETFKFRDHHRYSVTDIQKILNNFDAHLSTNKIIITTEKDVMRLNSPEILNLMKGYPVYYIPIQIEPVKDNRTEFDHLILQYVSKNH